jgi:putative redox protein
MVTINIEYKGDLRNEAVHQPSGTRLNTDAPKDNHGKGESFSPSDLVATSLGTCMLTIMGIVARNMNIDIKGAQVTVQKEMVTAPVRRIGKLGVQIKVPGKLTDEQKQKLENAAHTCPVHKSLHPDIQIPVEFVWG